MCKMSMTWLRRVRIDLEWEVMMVDEMIEKYGVERAMKDEDEVYCIIRNRAIFFAAMKYFTSQAWSKLKWSGRAKHCMAQLKACVSTVLLGGSGSMPPPPGKFTNSMP